jgi:hypothetical protein
MIKYVIILLEVELFPTTRKNIQLTIEKLKERNSRGVPAGRT